MNWCFQTVLLEKTLENPLESKEIKPVNPKGNQPWIVMGRTDTEAEAPIVWSPDAKSRLIEKHSDAGKGWGQEEKRIIKDGIVEWHHRPHGHEFELAPGVGDGQGGLASCSPWGCKVSDMTEWLNWTSSVICPPRAQLGPGSLTSGFGNMFSSLAPSHSHHSWFFFLLLISGLPYPTTFVNSSSTVITSTHLLPSNQLSSEILIFLSRSWKSQEGSFPYKGWK